MTDPKIQKRILLRLSNGITTVDELKQLVKLFSDEYKQSGKDILAFIKYQAFNELLRRLQTSVFIEAGKIYPIGFRKYCIYGEYHNTKLFIETVKHLIAIGDTYGDITDAKFYGQPDPDYKISLETLIHILLRHNKAINSFINEDSKESGHDPASFGFGAIASPMLTMLMALNVLDDKDWKKATSGKNLISHFSAGGQLYTVIRKGTSKEILSFYPRNDNLELDFVKLKRDPIKMQFIKE